MSQVLFTFDTVNLIQEHRHIHGLHGISLQVLSFHNPSNYDLVCMSVPKTVQGTVNFSAADTYTYTGLSFTIPANQAYIIIGSLSWNTGQPTELILSSVSDVASISRYNTYGRTDNSGDTGITLCTVTAQIIPPNSNETMYLYAKNASSSGKGSVRLTAIRIA